MPDGIVVQIVLADLPEVRKLIAWAVNVYPLLERLNDSPGYEDIPSLTIGARKALADLKAILVEVEKAKTPEG